MNDRISVILLCVVFILFSVLIMGCIAIPSPPDINAVNEQFQNYYEEIQVVVRFLVGSGYENILIQNASGTMLADLETRTIQDECVTNAVREIIDNGRYKKISKQGNTIYLLQWSGTQDMGCGVAYSINRIDLPEILYLTQLVPLPTDGWFYYVDDYNSWREGMRPTFLFSN